MLLGRLNAGDAEQSSAFVIQAAPIERVLVALGEPSRTPRISPAPRPPGWDDDPEPMLDCDLLGQPQPNVKFDQRIWSPPSSATKSAAAPDLTPARCACNLLSNPAEARSDTSERFAALSAAP
jgi:hypothetical protein